MRDNFTTARDWTFAYEGGLSMDRNDPGNWTGGKVGYGKLLGTKYGVAANSFPDLDIPNLTKEKAGEIYLAKYWLPAGCDGLPSGPDAYAYDIAVNAGVGRVKPWVAVTAGMEPVARVKALANKRRSFYQGLKTFSRYGKGWIRRANDLEAKCLKLAMTAAGMSGAAISTALANEADASTKTAKTQTAAAGATTATSAGGALTVDHSGLPIWAVLLIGVTVLILVAALIIKSAHQSSRAAAMKEASNG